MSFSKVAVTRSLLYIITGFSTIIGINEAFYLQSTDILSIEPTDSTVPEGNSISFICNSWKKQNLTWLLPNNQIVKKHRGRRIKQISNRLTIKNAKVTDSGVYTCLQDESTSNISLKVFVKPMYSYYLEELAMIGFNCCLTAIFILCCALKFTSFYEKQYQKSHIYTSTNI
uniref:Ig-like domain-containing protein n=1 Tax=Octopus bimaculoides TaxID=37653 RepID=A0A0L8GZU8_OCTBM